MGRLTAGVLGSAPGKIFRNGTVAARHAVWHGRVMRACSRARRQIPPARAFARRHLGELPGLQSLSRRAWMKESCARYQRRELDFGGCHCQPSRSPVTPTQPIPCATARPIMISSPDLRRLGLMRLTSIAACDRLIQRTLPVALARSVWNNAPDAPDRNCADG
jgi:hypothetical protein